MRVIVVGAGIAGLTAAIGLAGAGIDVEVVERANALTQAGTALSLWPNAQAALDRLGLATAVRHIGVEEPAGAIRDPSGRVLTRLDQSRLHQAGAAQTVIVRRGDLQRLLLDAAAGIPLRLRSAATQVRAHDRGMVVGLTTGEQLPADVVLGCDGIHSVVRRLIDTPAPRYRGVTTWRAVLEGSGAAIGDTFLTVGEGKQFIATRLPDDGGYWAAMVHLPEGANQAMPDKRSFLLDAFAHWHDPVGELIERTTEGGLVPADVFDAVPAALASGRAALLGDAGHPMTPDLGQGACLAIEDGVVVAACLQRYSDPTTALAAYQRARLRRARQVVRESRRLGAVFSSPSPTVARIRTTAVTWMPASVNRRLAARYASEAAFERTLPST